MYTARIVRPTSRASRYGPLCEAILNVSDRPPRNDSWSTGSKLSGMTLYGSLGRVSPNGRRLSEGNTKSRREFSRALRSMVNAGGCGIGLAFSANTQEGHAHVKPYVKLKTC